nr:MAG TPA: hypothetical protein [Caudoviricetes sp.]
MSFLLSLPLLVFVLCKYTKSIHTNSKEIARPCIRFEKNRIQGFLFHIGMVNVTDSYLNRKSLNVSGGTSYLKV